MLKGSLIVCVLATLAIARGIPVDMAASSKTAAPLAASHNQSALASVCRSMIPAHGNSLPQSGVAPYVLRVSQQSAAPGDTIQVKIYGENLEEFRGVYIQGRNGETPVGEFLTPGPESPPVTLTDCAPGVKNAASYISRQPINELTLSYIVPDVPTIIFRATFVKTFSQFWTNVISESVSITNVSV